MSYCRPTDGCEIYFAYTGAGYQFLWTDDNGHPQNHATESTEEALAFLEKFIAEGKWDTGTQLEKARKKLQKEINSQVWPTDLAQHELP